MEQTNLIELIQSLKPKEKDQILQFASLAFFNNGRMKAQVFPLLELCLSHKWDDPQQRLKKKEVFFFLFPNQEYVEGKVEKVMVEAHKVIRAFLLTQNYFQEENGFHQDFDFSEIVRKRGFIIRHQQLIKKLQKIQEESPWQNRTYFHRQFLLEYAVYEQECLQNQTRGDLNVPNALEALEMHCQLNRLTLINHFLVQQKAANVSIQEPIKTILYENSVPKRYLEKSSLLKINYEIFSMLKREYVEPSDVRSLYDLLLMHEKDLDQESLRKFYAYLRNLCVLVSNIFLDNEEIRVTLFDLYQDNLERGYLHFEGKLHPSTYLAVSLTAVRVKEVEWAIGFIEKYKDEIMGDNDQQDIYHFNKALYLFGMGRFSDCLDNIPFTSPFVDYLLIGKRLELKSLYELQSELLSYKLDAFKMFLSRTSPKLLSNTQKQLNVDFANLLTQISTSIKGDQKRADRVISRIQGKKQSAEWRWLLEK
ncbi:MAG: hypothetical protein ACKVT2_03525, partial [Saprospiraceae bacterium]